MPTYISGSGMIEVPFGHPSQYSIYINNVEHTGIDSWTFTERMNQVSTFSCHIYGVNSSDVNVQKGNIFKVFSQSNILYSGMILKVDYGSYNDAMIIGNKIGEVYLQRTQISTLPSAIGTPNRQEYDSIDTSTMTTEICNLASINVGTNTNFGQVSIRYENINCMSALDANANITGYDWFIDAPNYPFESPYFNTSSQLGNTSSIYTFNIGGTNQNIIKSQATTDTQNLCNSVIINGYGDGVNQLKVSMAMVSSIYSLLNSSIDSTDTSIVLTDASGFASSGEVIIGNEVIVYTGKSSNTLTGCTIIQKHNVGTMVIEYYDGVSYYTKTSPKSGSSIQLYGLYESIINDGSLIKDSDNISTTSAELSATRILLKQMAPINRIVVYPADIHDVSANVNMGDMITITDANAGLSGTYRVMGRTIGMDPSKGFTYELELSNVRLTYLQQMGQLQQQQTSSSLAMQGSTVIFPIDIRENCDDSTPLSLRFFIPSESININSATLKFTTRPWRASLSSDTSGEDTDKNVDVYNLNYNTVTMPYNSNWQDITGCLITRDSYTRGFTFVYVSAIMTTTPTSNTGQTLIRIKNSTDGTYYPSSLGVNIGCFPLNESGYYTLSGCIMIPDSLAGKVLLLQAMTQDGFNPPTNVIFSCSWTQIGTHTHSLSFGNMEDTFPTGSPQLVVVAGVESSETAVIGSPFSITNGGTYSADITTQAKTVGAGNWGNVKFTPQNGTSSNRVRIETDLYIQCFITSK